MWSPSEEVKGTRAASASLLFPLGVKIGESPVSIDTMVMTSSLNRKRYTLLTLKSTSAFFGTKMYNHRNASPSATFTRPPAGVLASLAKKEIQTVENNRCFLSLVHHLFQFQSLISSGAESSATCRFLIFGL